MKYLQFKQMNESKHLSQELKKHSKILSIKNEIENLPSHINKPNTQLNELIMKADTLLSCSRMSNVYFYLKFSFVYLF